jgi:hypothetical protein
MAGRVVPYLDSPGLYRWTKCAMEALGRGDVEALRTRLPLLLRQSDERVLEALAPTCEANGLFSLVCEERQAPEWEESAEAHPAMTQAPEVREWAEAEGSATQVPELKASAESHRMALQAPALKELAEEHSFASQVPGRSELAEEHRTASLAPEVGEPAEALLSASRVLAASERAEAPLPSAQAPEVGPSAPEPAGAGGAGAFRANRYGCLTGLREVPPGGSPPTPAPAAPGSTPSTGALWRQPLEEDSWPWPAHGLAPALT